MAIIKKFRIKNFKTKKELIKLDKISLEQKKNITIPLIKEFTSL